MARRAGTMTSGPDWSGRVLTSRKSSARSFPRRASVVVARRAYRPQDRVATGKTRQNSALMPAGAGLAASRLPLHVATRHVRPGEYHERPCECRVFRQWCRLPIFRSQLRRMTKWPRSGAACRAGLIGARLRRFRERRLYWCCDVGRQRRRSPIATGANAAPDGATRCQRDSPHTRPAPSELPTYGVRPAAFSQHCGACSAAVTPPASGPPSRRRPPLSIAVPSRARPGYTTSAMATTTSTGRRRRATRRAPGRYSSTGRTRRRANGQFAFTR